MYGTLPSFKKPYTNLFAERNSGERKTKTRLWDKRSGISSGKTKTPQTVTLQVKIERGQKAIKKSAHSSRPCSCLPLAPKFPSTKKQLNFHLQCYHLQCFIFARFLNLLSGISKPERHRTDTMSERVPSLCQTGEKPRAPPTSVYEHSQGIPPPIGKQCSP